MPMILIVSFMILTTPTVVGICPVQHVSIPGFTILWRMRSYLVSWWHPSTLLDQLLGVLVNFWSSFDDLINSGILPSSSTLNIAQGLFKTPQLHLYLALGLLGILQSDLLETLNCFHLLADIVRLGLESLVVLLDLVDHLGVLQDAAVMLKLNRLRLVLQLQHSSSGIIVSLLEVRKSGCSLAAEVEDRG